MTSAVVHKPLGDAAAAAVSLFWAGALAGVSFLATPVKFQAKSLDLPVALEVGKVTFALFTRCEWVLGLVLAAAVILTHASEFAKACAAATIGLLAAQALWLLPALDARVDAIIAGTPPAPSWHHALYAGSEAAKLLLLGAIALTAAFGLAGTRAGRGLTMMRGPRQEHP